MTAYKADGTVVEPTPRVPGTPPTKAEDHGLTGEQMRRKIAEHHKAALDAQQRHRERDARSLNWR